jgi:hypothetical protein
LAELDVAATEMRRAVAPHPAHLVGGMVLRCRQALGEADRAGPIAARRHRKIKRLVRSLGVVDLTPGIEAALAVVQVGEPPHLQHFDIHRAMKPLVLALGLRMIRTTVIELDAELHQPHRQRRMALRAAAAPG